MLSELAHSAVSAGSAPKPLHPSAVRVLAERRIDIAGRSSKDLDEFAGTRLAYVVSRCDRVREIRPEFPDHPEVIHWSVPDPSREVTHFVFWRPLTEIETRFGYLLELIGPRIEVAR